jgi:hypothetical protein
MLVVICLQFKLNRDALNYVLKKDMANQIVYTKTLMPYHGDATGKEFPLHQNQELFLEELLAPTVDKIK